jgi:hypothetical protein
MGSFYSGFFKLLNKSYFTENRSSCRLAGLTLDTSEAAQPKPIDTAIRKIVIQKLLEI